MQKIYTVCIAFVLLCGVAHAGKKFPMTAATIVPATRGEVEVDNDNNGNTKIKMNVEHLAHPESLTPPETAYVVWLQERNGTPENQGRLKVDKKLKASFETVTPARNFDLFVTAEQDALAKTPGGPEVLRATIQR